MAKIGVLLSGCGVKDGSEIHEAVLTLLSISRLGITPVCMAPNIEQAVVVNHISFSEMPEKQNVLVEAARIARGDIQDIEAIFVRELDAIILPGGFGAIQNISDFAFKGPDFSVIPSVEKLLRAFYEEKKPIGAICIAPVILAKVFAKEKAVVTVGNDIVVASAIRTLGSVHQNCTVDEICIDEKNRLVTTPAYMLGETIADIYTGIGRLVDRISLMIDEEKS